MKRLLRLMSMLCIIVFVCSINGMAKTNISQNFENATVNSLIGSGKLFEAASSSWIEYERPLAKDLQDSHSPHGSRSAEGFIQFIVFAKMRAVLVLPTPRGPQKRYAWANCPLLMEFLRVVAMLSWPIRERKLLGLYFRADTINFSITHKNKDFF